MQEFKAPVQDLPTQIEEAKRELSTGASGLRKQLADDFLNIAFDLASSGIAMDRMSDDLKLIEEYDEDEDDEDDDEDIESEEEYELKREAKRELQREIKAAMDEARRTAVTPLARKAISLVGQAVKILLTRTLTLRDLNRLYGTLTRRGEGYTPAAIVDAVAENLDISRSAAIKQMAKDIVLGSIKFYGLKKIIGTARELIEKQFQAPPKGDRTTDVEEQEKHSPPSMNYNGPSTNVERRLKLLLPKKKLAGKVKTGSASYVFPINLQDMVAFEHDLLYATDDPLIQQLADLRYLNYNFKNRGAFIKRVKDLGVDLPDDLKLMPVLVSSAAISSQAYIRSFGGFGKIIQDALIKYVAGGSFFNPSISIKTGEPKDILTMLQLGLSRDNPVLAKKVAAEYGLDVEAVKAFIEGRTDKLDIPKYNKFINAAEETSDKMFKMMSKYGKFDNKGRYTVDKIDMGQFKGDLTDLYKDFNVMTDEQFKADGYRGYNKLPEAPAKENLDVFNKRIEKVITANIDTEKPEQRIDQQIFTEEMADIRQLGMRPLIGEIQDRDSFKKEIFVSEYKKDLESRRLPVPSDADLGKMKTPEDRYDYLTEYAWKNSKVKDSNTLSAIAAAEDKIDDKVINFIKDKIGPDHLKRIEVREKKEDTRLERTMQIMDERAGKKPVTEMIGGKRVASKANLEGKDVQVEVPVGPKKEDRPISLTPADNVLDASKSAIKEQPKVKAAKTTSETSATAKPAPAPVTKPAPTITEKKEGEKVRKAEAAPEVPMPAAVTEEPVVLPKAQKEPVGLPPKEQKAAVEAMQEGKVKMRSSPEGKAPDNLVESAVNPIDRIVDKLMTKSSKEEREEMRALIAFITPPDQTGGLGNVRSNPLVRDNAKHEKKVVIGEGDLYKDTVKNHLLANTSNLAMLQQFDKTTVDSRMKAKREAPRRFTSLVRQVPDILTTQRQAKAETRDFINTVNPPSAFAHGSQYGSYFQPVGRAGNYLDDRDLTRYWGNPSTSFTPVRYQNP